MKIRPKCGCGGAPNLMFCCSGVADTAEIGDRAVRAVHRSGEAKMYCLAGIAADVELIVVNSRAANRTVVVDGCDSDCAKKTMEKQGFAGFAHLRVTDFGWEKGKTPVTEERIQLAAAKLRELFATEPARAEA